MSCNERQLTIAKMILKNAVSVFPLAGHVMLTEELLFHTGASEYVLEVTPSDNRASNDPRNLTIFIISKS